MQYPSSASHAAAAYPQRQLGAHPASQQQFSAAAGTPAYPQQQQPQAAWPQQPGAPTGGPGPITSNGRAYPSYPAAAPAAGSSYPQQPGLTPVAAIPQQNLYPTAGPPVASSPFLYSGGSGAAASARPLPPRADAAAVTDGRLPGIPSAAAAAWRGEGGGGGGAPAAVMQRPAARQQPLSAGGDTGIYPGAALYPGGSAAIGYEGSNNIGPGLPPPPSANNAAPSPASVVPTGYPYPPPAAGSNTPAAAAAAWGSSWQLQQQQQRAPQQHMQDAVRVSNAPRHFVRASVQRLPHSSSLQQKLHVPLGLVLQPLAPVPVGCALPPTVGLSSSCGVVVRCRRCRTYVNALVRWESGGRRWGCNVCGFVNDTPQFYLSSAAALDYDAAAAAAGRAPTHAEERQQLQHPELTVGSVEFIAPADYMVRPPQPPAYLFLIDVSAAAVAAGLVDAACAGIRKALISGKLPGTCCTSNSSSCGEEEREGGRAGEGVAAAGGGGRGLNESCNGNNGKHHAAAGTAGAGRGGNATGAGSRTMVGIMTFDSTVHFYYALDSSHTTSNSGVSADGSTAADRITTTATAPFKRRMQVLVMPEIDDVFLPLSDGLFVHYEDNKDAVLHTLDRIPDLWRTTTCVDNCMGSALKAALLTMKHVGGKLLLFTTRLPTVGAFVTQRGAAGAGQQQQQQQVDREVELLKPGSDVYQQFVVQLTQAQVSVDIFAAPTAITPIAAAAAAGSKVAQQQHIKTATPGGGAAAGPPGTTTAAGISSSCSPFDLATLLPLAQLTGGEVRFYEGFNKLQHGQQLQNEIFHILTRNTGWEAVMRVRVSRGWRVSARYGRFLLRGADLFVLPCVNEDSTFSVLLHIDESTSGLPPAAATGGGSNNTAVASAGNSSSSSNNTDALVTVQAALLYTNSDGERRIRVHTFALPVSQSVKDIVSSIDPDVVAYLLTQQAIDVSLRSKITDGRAFLQNSCSQLLGVLQSVSCSSSAAAATGLHHSFPHGHYGAAAAAAGGTAASNNTAAAALVEAGRRIALLVMGLLKGVAFRGSRTVGPDERVYAWSRLQALSVEMLCAYLYPRLIAVHALDSACTSSSPAAATAGATGRERDLVLPQILRLSAEELTQDGAYLLENGEELLLWIGRSVSSHWLAAVLGVQTLDFVQPEAAGAWLEQTAGDSNPTGKSVRDVVQLLRRERAPDWMNLLVIRQGDPLEHRFFAQLIEDRVPSLLLSFTEFLQRVDVRGLLHTPSLGGGAAAAGALAYSSAAAAAAQPPPYVQQQQPQQQPLAAAPPPPHPLQPSMMMPPPAASLQQPQQQQLHQQPQQQHPPQQQQIPFQAPMAAMPPPQQLLSQQQQPITGQGRY